MYQYNQYNQYNFDQEFKKIDSFIEQEMYREAGTSCGYMLEYILLRICRALKAEAKNELSDSLNTIIKKIGGEIEHWQLGELIRFITTSNPLKAGASKRQKSTLLTLACQTLNITCKHSLHINFSCLGDMRNACIHVNSYASFPSKGDIQIFQSSLRTLSIEFKEIFPMEMATLPVVAPKETRIHESPPTASFAVKFLGVMALIASYYFFS